MVHSFLELGVACSVTLTQALCGISTMTTKMILRWVPATALVLCLAANGLGSTVSSIKQRANRPDIKVAFTEAGAADGLRNG
jgi:hypothetical protein